MIAPAAELEVKTPTIFSPGTVVVISLWGLILVVPVVAVMMWVSLLQFGALTFLIPLLTIAAATFFLPVGFGNLHVARLARPLLPAGTPAQGVYLVQLTRKPRNRSGFLAVLEDADDIGFLSLSDAGLTFVGDSVRLRVPYEQLKKLRLRNAGWRGLFAYGPQTVLEISGLPEAGSFAFAERASWHLPGSRKNAGEMYRQLVQKCGL